MSLVDDTLVGQPSAYCEHGLVREHCAVCCDGDPPVTLTPEQIRALLAEGRGARDTMDRRNRTTRHEAMAPATIADVRRIVREEIERARTEHGDAIYAARPYPAPDDDVALTEREAVAMQALLDGGADEPVRSDDPDDHRVIPPVPAWDGVSRPSVSLDLGAEPFDIRAGAEAYGPERLPVDVVAAIADVHAIAAERTGAEAGP